jgi:hypothetical protein
VTWTKRDRRRAAIKRNQQKGKPARGATKWEIEDLRLKAMRLGWVEPVIGAAEDVRAERDVAKTLLAARQSGRYADAGQPTLTQRRTLAALGAPDARTIAEAQLAIDVYRKREPVPW